MNLVDVLDRATDRIEPPRLARAALVDAGRRRARRRALAGTAATVAVVVAGATFFVAPGVDGTEPGPTGTSTPDVPAPSGADPGGIDPDHPPLWDPFTIADAPFGDSVLPERLEPPVDAPGVAEDPMDAAVIAWPEEGSDLRLLGVDGRWRSVPGTANAVTGTLQDVVRPELSSDGTRVAMSSDDGILVVDVTTGEEEVVPWPDAISAPSDTAPALLWLPDDAGFLVLHWTGTWVVEPDGAGHEAAFGGEYGGWLAVDPDDGQVVDPQPDRSRLVVWRHEEVAGEVYFPHRGERLVTRHGLVAFTSGSLGRYPRGGPVVADVASGELVAYAPIRDPSAVYSDNAHLTAQGFLDEDTVLLLVTPMDSRTMDVGDGATYLVAWHFRTGEFERLTSGDNPRMRTIDVATDLVDGR